MKHFCSWIQKNKLQNTFFLLLLLLVACSDSDKELEEPVPPEPPVASITFAENTDRQPLVESSGGTFSVSFTATASWTASVGNSRADSWITVSPTSGEAGEASVSVTVAPSESTDERSASVFLTCGEAKETIVVTQKQKDALILSHQIYELPATESVVELEIQSNVSYMVEVSDEWIEQVTSRGLQTETLTFRVKANDTEEKRSGTITVKSDSFEETVRIYQEGKEEEKVLFLNEDVMRIGAEGGTLDVQLQSNVDYTYHAEAEYDWITEPSSRAVSTHTVHLEVQPNETYDSREARFIFSDETGALTDTLLVCQDAARGLLVNDSHIELTAEDTGFSLVLQTNVPYTVSIEGDWLKQVTSRGLTTETLTFSCEQNNSTVSREAIIGLSSEIGKQEVKVTQAGKEEVVSDFMNVSPPSLSLEASASSFMVSVSTNVSYYVASNVDWITTSVSGLTNAPSVTFDVAVNEETVDREGIITFTSEDGSITRTVTVTQAGKEITVLDVSPASFFLSNEAVSVEINVESNTKYSVSSDVPWLTTSASGLIENPSVTFDVAANEETTDRKGTITFTSEDGSVTCIVTVTQVGKEITVLDVSSSLLFLSNEATSVEINVEGNTRYSVSSDVPWLTTSASGLIENHSVTFDVAANEETTDRKGTITFTSEDGSVTCTVTVAQSGKEATVLNVSPASFSLLSEAASVEINVEGNTRYSVSSDVPWLTTSASGLIENPSVTFDVAANEETTDRKGTITFTSEDGSIERTVTVMQAGKEATFLNVSPASFSLSSEATSVEVNVDGNTKYRVSIDVPWLTTSASGLIENPSVTFDVAANEETTDRKGTITFISEDGSIERTVTVMQAGKEVTVLNVSPASFSLSDEATSIEVIIEGNTKYNVSSNDSWLTIPVSGPTEAKSLLVAVSANEETVDRKGTITFTSEDGSIERTVTVTQAGKEATVLNVSPPSFSLSSEATSVEVNVEGNTKYSVSSDVPWLTTSASGLIENFSVIFAVAANGTTAERKGTITFISEDGSIMRTVTVIQAGEEPYLNVTPQRIDAPAEGGTYLLVIRTNATGSNVNLNGNAWISLQDGNLVIAANPDRSARTGEVIVTAGELNYTIEVSQAGKQPSTAGGQIEDFTESEENW